MSNKLLFLGWRDTIVRGAGDSNAPHRANLVADCIPALLHFCEQGYQLVVLRNQHANDVDIANAADNPDIWILELLNSQGIPISETLECPHNSTAGCNCRLPGVGLVTAYIKDMDRQLSAVVSADAWTEQFGQNLGIEAIRLDATHNWNSAAHQILERPRQSLVQRKTRETDISVAIDLDSAASPSISTGLAFFDHMLEQLGKHGGFSLEVSCKGDLEVDEHHTIEDVAIALGTGLREALGDKRGVHRYGFVLPMDEAQAQASIDLSGRAYLVFKANFPRDEIGGMPTELIEHFFRSLSDALAASLHIGVTGNNTHHMVEACFKAVARALRMAKERSGNELASTKGIL